MGPLSGVGRGRLPGGPRVGALFARCAPLPNTLGKTPRVLGTLRSHGNLLPADSKRHQRFYETREGDSKKHRPVDDNRNFARGINRIYSAIRRTISVLASEGIFAPTPSVDTQSFKGALIVCSDKSTSYFREER